MSSWDDRFENHPALTSLTKLEQLLVATRSLAESDADALDQFERIHRFTLFSRNKFDSADPLLASPPHLNNFNTSFQSIIDEIVAYKSDNKTSHLETANKFIDGTLTNFTGLHIPRTEKDTADLQDAASSYRKSVSQLARNLQEEISKVNELNLSLNDTKISAQDQVNTISHLVESAKDQLEMLAKVTISKHFGGVAEDEQKRADTWTEYAKRILVFWFAINFIIFMYSGIESFNILGFVLTFTHGDQSQGVVHQLLFTTPLLLFSGFAALKVSAHQRSARMNRRTYVELLTIESYLGNLEENVQNDIKKSFAEKLFGQREEDGQKADSLPSLTFIADILKLGKSSGPP